MRDIEMSNINEEDIADEICEYEDQFEEDACEQGKYYIGTYTYIESENVLLFNTRINRETFFEFTQQELSAHAYYTSIFNPLKKPSINIIQLIILSDDTYMAISKTFWLKIIQRTWKNACKKRALFRRAILSNLASIQFRRKPSYLQYPTLSGLLSHYGCKNG